jgi:hypothetical protein
MPESALPMSVKLQFLRRLTLTPILILIPTPRIPTRPLFLRRKGGDSEPLSTPASKHDDLKKNREYLLSSHLDEG